MMWIYDREPLREHRPGPPAGGRTWEETLAGVELGSDNLDRKKLKKKKQIILTYHCRGNIDNDVMKEIHLKIVLYHRVSTTTTVLSAKEEREILKTAEAGARIASVSPRQTGYLLA